jgi:hypothetical protein
MKNKRLKVQFDERKRKLIISGTICSAKKRFSPVNLLSPDSIQEGEEKNITMVAQEIPLRIVGYVELQSAVPVSKILFPLLKT